MDVAEPDREYTVALPGIPDYRAPDGSEVRLLCQGRHAGMAHFRLPVSGVSRAIRHRTVDELWYVVSGAGLLWRARPGSTGHETRLSPGVSVLIVATTEFQFRTLGDEPLGIVAATVPPWPGEMEAEYVGPHWPED